MYRSLADHSTPNPGRVNPSGAHNKKSNGSV
uniref:Uncharacterized protein n=1 Tax=Arundo donax TaxID=35708 RepID=A0A0A9G199_ARUDO